MERTFENGRQVVVVRSSGPARWIAAGFLCFWLCGWAMGEVAGLGLLLGVAGLLGGAEVRWLPRLPAGAAAPAALFALLWTSFWTLGGVLAIREVLRLLWGVDRIEYDAAGITRIARIGPFVSTRTFAREEIRGVALHRTALSILTARGPVPLVQGGSRAEQSELKSDLERTLALGQAVRPPELPASWESGVDLEGMPVLQRRPALRQRQGALVGFLAAGLGAAALVLARRAMSGSDPRLWVPAAILGAFASGAAAGAAWLGFGREAIRMRAGQAEVHRWLAGRKQIEIFAPVSLALEHSTDGDGDDLYRLVMVGPSARKNVAQSLYQPDEPLEIGRWMAQKLGCELRLPPELKARVDAA
jgi:hypothetical protein